MRLRADREGKPFVVLEAGDISRVEQVACLLDGIARHRAPCAWADNMAKELRRLLSSDVDGVQLPKKREAKAEAVSEPPVVAADEPPFVPGDRTATNGAPSCSECGEKLSPSEIRRDRTRCFTCQPVPA